MKTAITKYTTVFITNFTSNKNITRWLDVFSRSLRSAFSPSAMSLNVLSFDHLVLRGGSRRKERQRIFYYYTQHQPVLSSTEEKVFELTYLTNKNRLECVDVHDGVANTVYMCVSKKQLAVSMIKYPLYRVLWNLEVPIS